MKSNTYTMWPTNPTGPTIVLPATHHWDAGTQEVVANDLSWRGDLMAWYRKCQETGLMVPGKATAPATP